ncbi:tubulin polymerization-promoting protein homolog [Pectinophora gossypiella]|uniref:tubulin polymerization-promoting protein homolog n=1 Tax=Pectinophora gossypiella TaxID=13191 RepID=UPI00214DF926|nr:tubulin polymerization-promoting protein homolog [Pectinophora gossypiella]
MKNELGNEVKDIDIACGLLAEKQADDEPGATLDSQFFSFAKMGDKNRDGTTITLSNSDYWMRQATILDDKILTMVDTGHIFFSRYNKTEITWNEWLDYIDVLCMKKELDVERVKDMLTVCGLPGEKPVDIPQYRNFFANYKKKEKSVMF